MSPALLIAANFLREQRWFIVLLLLYIVMLSSVYLFMPHAMAQEFVFLLRQLSVLALLFSLSLATGAIHNERRTRRVLAVLSKGISRQEYLAGYMLGSLAISAIYCAGMLAIAFVMHFQMHTPLIPVFKLIALTLAGCLVTNNLGLFFSTILHPLFSVIATVLVLAFPFALVQWFQAGDFVLNWLPVALLVSSMSSFSLTEAAWHFPALALWVCLAEGIVFWLAAGWIFSKRDVAVPVE